MRIRKSGFIICVAAAFVLGVLMSAVFSALFIYMPSTGSKAGIDESKLAQINAYIDKYYLWDDYDKKELTDNAYRGSVAGLGDIYSSYMTKEDYDSYETSSLGTYSG
ncbi:MAG: hypothetical protein IJ128_00150, partial [Firmicutes bacterium]|nr:hypothetical protein [Bacillota bacterium]